MKRLLPRSITFAFVIAVLATIAGAAAVLEATPLAALPPFPATPPTLVSTNPVDNTPFVNNGRVEALAQVGDRIIVGGTFTSVKRPTDTVSTPRTYLFSYNRLTGAIDPGFAPVLDGAVYAIEPSSDGTAVFVGGAFKTVNGAVRTYLVKLDATTGAAITQFGTATNGVVYDLAKQGSNLFVIGWFSRARSTNKGGLIQVDQTTGKFTGSLDLALATTRTQWGSGVRTVDVTPNGATLVIGGNFTSVGGVARDQVALIDLTTAPASVKANWNTASFNYPNPEFGTYIRDIAMSPDGTFFVVGTSCWTCTATGDGATRWSTTATGTNVQPEWSTFTAGDTITAVAITAGGVVYLGGHMKFVDNRYPGFVTVGFGNRYGLAAFDASTGRSYQWAPSRERGYGVLALLVTTSGDLVVGHDSPTVGGEKHPNLAAFPAAGGRMVNRAATPGLPTAVSLVSPGGAVTTRTFDGTTVSSTAPTALLLGEVRAGFVIDSRLIAATNDGVWVYVADSAGRWVRGWRLVVGDVAGESITAMAFHRESLWYTILGDPHLHRRTMSSDSFMIDPNDAQVSGPAAGDGRDWSQTRGLFAAADRLYVAGGDGTLTSLPFTAAANLDIQAPTATHSGPAIDGQSWASALFAGSAPTAVPERPNLALGRASTSSTTQGPAFWAVDGVRDAHWSKVPIAATNAGTNQWWEVDLGSKQLISSIVVWPRSDDNGSLINPWIMVSDTPITGSTINNMTSASGVTKFKINGFLFAGSGIPINKSRRYVRIATAGMENTGVQLAEVEVMGAVAPIPAPTPGQNVALRQPVAQSSWGEPVGSPERAVDGGTNGSYWAGLTTTQTGPAAQPTGPWWQTDLGRTVNVGSIRIWNRTDCCADRLFPAKVFVSASPFTSMDPVTLEATPGVTTLTLAADPGVPSATLTVGSEIRYVRVQLPGSGRILSLAEVEVFAL